jgi:lysyl-tRNA synthetase class 2
MSLAFRPNHVDMKPEKLRILRDRAEMFRNVREFFFSKGICEVDCPLMNRFASVDIHIDLIRAYTGNPPETHYLHSSPEYAMKRLLVEGMGDIYQLSHVFRDNEYSMRHNPEFTMAEWYRLDYPFPKMIDETIDFIRLFIGDVPHTIMTYEDMFKKYAGIDYKKITEKKLCGYLKEKGINPYENIEEEGKDAYLNLIMGVVIEPQLGRDEIFVVYHFPASQSMLSKTTVNEGVEVAERFEVFYKGYELANGYHELTDAVEQRKRLARANKTRAELGKDTLPIDERFLGALEKGMPDSCGVAVGFDRLMMLRHDLDDIADVLPLTER